jgi:hypothetical protein
MSLSPEPDNFRSRQRVTAQTDEREKAAASASMDMARPLQQGTTRLAAMHARVAREMAGANNSKPASNSMSTPHMYFAVF